jgi:23S rRNA (pseudouridine1915-N3)-methyltransferase
VRLTIASIGRWSNGPEQDLYATYADRLAGLGRRQSIGPIELKEIVLKSSATGDEKEEARALLNAASDPASIVTLHEKGRQLTSVQFAELLASWRDDGAREATFLIGGAAGHGAQALDNAKLILSLGHMTWPHMLTRALLAEQLYRAVTIMAGHPYHRKGSDGGR